MIVKTVRNQVKPRRARLGTGWVTHREYRREGPYFVLSLLVLLYCILCGVLFKSLLKSILSNISAAGFSKKKTQKRQYSSRENYYRLTSGRRVQN